MGDQPQPKIVVEPLVIPDPETIPKTHPFHKGYQTQGPPPAGTNPWDLYTPTKSVNKGARKVITLDIDRAIDVPRAQNAMGKHVIGGYAIQVSTFDGFQKTPYIGTFEPKIDMTMDHKDKEQFEIHQSVDIDYYGDKLPAGIKLTVFRCDGNGKPYCPLGVTVLDPKERRSLDNHAYAIEDSDRTGGKPLGGIYIRLSGENVGQGEESLIEGTHYSPNKQKTKFNPGMISAPMMTSVGPPDPSGAPTMKGPGGGDLHGLDGSPVNPKVTLKHHKPVTASAEVFVNRVMDMSRSAFGGGAKYLEIKVESGEVSFSRVKLAVNRGIYCQRQEDGSIKWTWGDTRPQLKGWEMYRQTFYNKDPLTGIVTKQSGDEESESQGGGQAPQGPGIFGPYYPKEDSVHPDTLESIIVDETVYVPCGSLDRKGLTLKVKLGSMSFLGGYNVIGESEPIPVERVNFAVPCEYQFAKMFSVASGKHVGTITLACQLVTPQEVGKTIPRVPYVEGFWARDCIFGPYANESKPQIIGVEEFQERMEERRPKFSRTTYSDRGTETRERHPIVHLPYREDGLGMFSLNHQVAPLIGPGGADYNKPSNAPFAMADPSGVDWIPLKPIEDDDDDGDSHDPNKTGGRNKKTLHRDQNAVKPNPRAVDIKGVKYEGVATHRQLHEGHTVDPDPYQPWNRPTCKQIHPQCTGGGGGSNLGIPMAKDIEKYASDLVTKSGPLNGPSQRDQGCPMA